MLVKIINALINCIIITRSLDINKINYEIT